MGKSVVRGLALLQILAGLLIIALPGSAGADSDKALVISVGGVIDPVNARFVSRAVKKAGREEFRLLIVRIDTPGGLDTSMRKIIQSLLNSPVPTVVYVSPQGARSASAGVFITAAAHVAAMAPGTNIGAAHPVFLGGELPDTLADKVTNDAAAFVRSIADARGRNADWYEMAVRRSVSATAEEALEQNVVDLIAIDLQDLLRQLHGRTVVVGDQTVTLDTQGLGLQNMGLTFFEGVLHVIVDPNIAFILMTVGGLLLLSELFHPTLGAGVVGAILLVMAYMALGSLPLNWAGVALIIFGVVLMAAEILVAGFGVLGLGGIAAFVVGALILFSPFQPSSPTMSDMRISLRVLVPFVIIIFLGGGLVFRAIVQSRKPVPERTASSLVGQIGEATTDLTPRGSVRVRHELWTAIAEGAGNIAVGERVRVLGIEGIILTVGRPDGEPQPAQEGS